MSNKRKDMWKLLYNLVSRNETVMDEVFGFVDDILCKEPSLIKPYSLKEANNRFQDTFILWLINKFIKCLEESTETEIQECNLNLQQKILISCLVNRSSLFEHLVELYIKGIKELTEQLSKINWDSLKPDETRFLVMKVFQSEDNCLQEIDANFCFQDIKIHLDHADRRIQDFLQILQVVAEVGMDFYPNTFISSFECALHAMIECDMSVKLKSINYCSHILKLAEEMTPLLEGYYSIVLHTMYLIWSRVPVWFHRHCMKREEVEFLLKTTCEIITTECRHLPEIQEPEKLIIEKFLLLETLIEAKDSLENVDFLEVFQVSSAFMIAIKELNDDDFCLNEKHYEFLWFCGMKIPILLKILIVSLKSCKDLLANQHFIRLTKEIASFDRSSFENDLQLELFKELLKGFLYLEQVSDTQINLVFLSNHFNKQTFQNQIQDFLNEADNCIGNPIKQSLCLSIASLVLKSKTFSEVLSEDQHMHLLMILQKPLNFILKPSNQNNIPSEQSFLSLKSLKCLCRVNVSNDTPNLYKQFQLDFQKISKQLFSSLLQNKNLTKDLIEIFCEHVDYLVVKGFLSAKYILQDLISSVKNSEHLAKFLKPIYCLSEASQCHFFCYNIYNKDKYFELICEKCQNWKQHQMDHDWYLKENKALQFPNTPAQQESNPSLPLPLKRLLTKQIFINDDFEFIGHHLRINTISPPILMQSLNEKNFSVSTAKLKTFRLLINNFMQQDSDFIQQISVFVLQLIKQSLKPPIDIQFQKKVLEMLNACTDNPELSEQRLFHFFKMTFFYLLHTDSGVVHEAIVCGSEMCAKHNLQPIHFWNWYKRDCLSLIINLAVHVYLNKGIRLTRSLKAFTKMLGFSCVQEFICKYYRLLTTMILPFCIKEPISKGLLVSISKLTRKPISNIFIVSFLRVYTHIYLTEDADVGNKCIELFVKCTGSNLNMLMNSDVKQTVCEFLIYFNRNPTFVMKAFQCLLLNDNSNSSSSSSRNALATTNSSTFQVSDNFAKFIADRFLGVITYFEASLATPIFEKPLKEEALYSLGQIIRFVGADHVTQFRFKIISMLSFVLSLNDPHLQDICLKIWNIFLHIVNIQELGPSLSRIVASLQPLLERKPDEVNAIYEFVILKNDSLLGAYIPELYFLEDIESVAPAIRQCVARQTDILKSDKYSVHDKLGFLYKQITNDNLQVRIYGLQHLRRFIGKQRKSLNHIILNELKVNPVLEHIVDILIAGCRHDDHKLQLASAKCLGELGALDPSFMPFNFACIQAHELPLSVHTDDFAIMALTELCRAHQFQKETKYVDSFSLAIQETLAVCGVSPKEKKKLNVWEAIPVRLRHVMEPLLNSCYTGSRRESKCKEHPIFGSSYCRSYEDWAFLWAGRLIDYVVSDETKHLLNSYRPSIRRDSNTMTTFFPYIVLHALQECKVEELEQMYEEFNAVFDLGKQNFTSSHDFEPSRPKQFKSLKYSADCGLGDGNTSNSKSHQTETFTSILRHSVKLCSEQIDFLQRWKREWEKNNPVNPKTLTVHVNYKRVCDFLNRFDGLKLAEANFNAGEYARALLYLEQYIEVDSKDRFDGQVPLLISVYGKLQDVDSAEGSVHISKSKWKVMGELEVSKILDRPQDLTTCYETLFQDNEDFQPEHVEGLVDCYLRMDTPQTALFILDGLWHQVHDNPHYNSYDEVFKKSKFDVLWRLGSYDEMFDLLKDSEVKRKKSSWNTHCAEAFLLFQKSCENQSSNFYDDLENVRTSVLQAMRASSSAKHNSYPHCYDEVVKLHLIDEIDKSFALFEMLQKEDQTNTRRIEAMKDFFNDWDDTLSILQPTVRVIEPLLNLRRNLLKRMDDFLQETPLHSLIQKETGKLWLLSAQMNRNAGCLRQAQISLENAEAYEASTLFIERAKLLWNKGEQTKCFKLLDENLSMIEDKCQKKVRNLENEERLIYAEAKLLQAAYNAESMNICSELNLRYFKEAVVANKTSEEANLQLAQYNEKIFASFTEEQKNGENGRKMLLEIMMDYARSLRYGYQNVYQSLPRLLSLWLDFTSQCATYAEQPIPDNSIKGARLSELQELAKEMNSLIDNCCTVFPAAIFYTTFSQLLSRICHPSNDVFNVLRSIFIKLIEQFPQQSLWMLLPIFKSSYTHRIKRCKLIFTDTRLSKPQFQKLLNDFNMLAERLIELTNKDVAMDKIYELSTLVKQLPKLFEDPSFSQILLPLEKFMQASFPISASFTSLHLGLPSNVGQENLPASSYFPYKQVYICGIHEEVAVLRSAAKPKKIIIRCSDGKEYPVMVKPKDDLRKDFRLMEFNGLVKRYLHQDPQARHRRLRIRTYAAIPFNEECGLVEWLPNLNSFRSICIGMYRMRGQGLRDGQLRQCIVQKTDPIEKKRSIFIDILLSKHPPVFHEWFRQRFPTPHSWYEARTSYIKTIAVMSMVGYILGLGDRHGENVLFDETNGDAVHVDFNCLFNQGENFAVPELVPFRLTHNMTFAMGPLGVEGLYRKCCEITLRLLKQESKTLMSVLRPFVYDLVALNRNYNKKQTGAELTDPKALNDVKRIDERLQGYVKRNIANSMPLSTEGQVNFLISEATNMDNLASMYIGWGAYI